MSAIPPSSRNASQPGLPGNPSTPGAAGVPTTGPERRQAAAGDHVQLGAEARKHPPQDPYDVLLYMKAEESKTAAPGKRDGKPISLAPTSNQSAFWATKRQKAEATKALTANAAAEAAGREALGDRAAAYDHVRAQVQQDPMAARALQKMLLDGRLTGQKDLNGEKDLLGHLNDLATQPNAGGVKTPALLGGLVRELENPATISQGDGDIGTCVATSVTIAAAMHDPAEVARLVAGLAKDQPGSVRMHAAPGEPADAAPLLERPANWNVDTHGKGGDRTPSMRLLQPALMNYAMAARQRDHGIDPGEVPLRYDPRTDAFTPSGTPDARRNGGRPAKAWARLNDGLDSNQANHLYEHLVGQHTEARRDIRGSARDEVMRGIDRRVSGPNPTPVPVGLNYKDGKDAGGHELLVVGAEGPPGKRRYHVADPIMGGHHVWSARQLRSALDEANLPDP